MTLFKTSKFVLTSSIAVTASALLFPTGCGGDDEKKKSSSTTGGSTSHVSFAGNPSLGNGGTTAAEGGTTASPQAGTGNDNGGPSTTLPDIDCESDLACKDLNLLCDTNAKKCVQCITASHCDDGQACVGGLCGARGGCTTNAECASSSKGSVCEISRGRCVGCVSASDCPNAATSECINFACVSFSTCEDSRTCPGAQVCDPTLGRCVECVSPNDCNVNDKTGLVCANNTCQPGCTADDGCTGTNTHCDTKAPEPYCAACIENADCTKAQHCAKGMCVANVCEPGVDQACISGGVAVCNESGDGFGAPKACPPNVPCTVVESRAACGSLTPSNCAGNTTRPCSAIPAFAGTQVVDGSGADLCDVPGFVLAFDSTAAKINQTEGETASKNSYPERATFRVAWSATHLHAYIEVVDPSVNANTNPAAIWDGDGVELMISTSRNVTGLTSTDANTLHVIGNAVIGVTVKASGESGNHTQIYEPSQFKGQLTDKGYAVEFMMPWPEGATLASGTQIYFDAALNAASKNADGSAPRKAQALLFQATTTETSCTGTGSNIAPFCDDRLWCPTQAQ
ncbi:MAG TPA: sugar-binding protein [Polyangiaceae bacterium]|nr:sugar-binding protein [Polyangiaceae bacterium]